MKPRALALLAALFCAPAFLRAQTISPADGGKTIENLKKKYASGGQKPEAAARSPEAPAAPNSKISIVDIEDMLVRTGCKISPEDTSDLAPSLKGKYGLAVCRGERGEMQQVLLVPESVSPGQQLVFGSIRGDAGNPGFKLLHARLVDHYFVIQFDKQTQYLDLLKQEKGSAFHLAGLYTDGDLSRFEDIGIFKDALKNYAGVNKDSEIMFRISELTAKAAGGKPYLVEARKLRDTWIVILAVDGNVSQVWPERKKT